MACPLWVEAVASGKGRLTSPTLAGALHFHLASGPANYAAASDCRDLCFHIPLLSSVTDLG